MTIIRTENNSICNSFHKNEKRLSAVEGHSNISI